MGCSDDSSSSPPDGERSGSEEGDAEAQPDSTEQSNADSDAELDPVYVSDIDFYDPDADIDFDAIDPSIDPGFHPVFRDDPFFQQDNSYTYTYTVPGDHALPDATCVLQFDASGRASLFDALQPIKVELADCTGLALYLTESADSLRDEDLRTLQILDWSEAAGGLEAGNLSRLYVYNLKSLQGGTEYVEGTNQEWPNTGESCEEEGAGMSTGVAYPLWINGWHESWVKHIVMDDLVDIPDGAFCRTKLFTLSFRGAQSVGVMAFAEQLGTDLNQIYLPNVKTIAGGGFKRIKPNWSDFEHMKIYLPRVEEIGSNAFDDNNHLHYVSAPNLRTMGRNVFNDCWMIIAVYLPKLEYMEHANFGPNENMRVLNLPSLKNPLGDCATSQKELKFAYFPALETMGPMLRIDHEEYPSSLKLLYVPKLEQMGADAVRGAHFLTRLHLDSEGITLKDGALNDTGLEELYLTGAVKTLQGSPFSNSGSLKHIHFGDTPPIQADSNTFEGTSADLIGYYTGDDPAWDTFEFNGNSSATLVQE